ncbi:MAG TPA: class I SAM-dependent methyltransferase [Kofleriaceae bacterium]|nr:class I SAM-dependent methyltransferase [Kofleriaceae bacterium]
MSEHRGGSARISPTAHFTGYVWYRNGLGDPALRTRAGRLLVAAFSPIDRAARLAGGPALEDVLLGRHRAIDERLELAIERGEVEQVLEVAAGLSPRGLRFIRRHGQRLFYIEGDLPAMARRKRQALAHADEPDGANHLVVEIDALADDAPGSLADVAARFFDPARGLAIITEGLLNYFDRATVEAMWARFARVLSGFRVGLYLSDLHLGEDMERTRGARAFATLLSVFARGRVHFHYGDSGAAGRSLLAAGFAEARFYPAARNDSGSGAPAPVRILEARTTPRPPDPAATLG